MPARETTFEALGQTWRFKFGFNALCSLEEDRGKPFLEVILGVFPELDAKTMMDEQALLKAVASVSASELRAAFLAGLSEAHPDLTSIDAGNIIEAIGADKAGDIIKASIAADMGGGESTRNPPRKARQKR